jgi:hypothetical protein
MITRKKDRAHVPQQSVIACPGVDCGSLCVEGAIINWVRGVIHSQYVGLLRAGVRIKVGARTDLRIRWARRAQREFVVGQPVVATIPAGTVRLESGMFRRSKQRWNRWVGRIVFIEHLEAATVYTVKVHGEEWTIKSLGPILGAQGPSRPWDIVNIVVDPQLVDLSISAPCLVVRPT